MKCIKCNNPLSGKQEKFCSTYCSKLYLKAEYRKRKKEHIHAYKKERRELGKGNTKSSRPTEMFKELLIGKSCRACGAIKNLTVNHIVPMSIGGGNEETNLEVLCVSCNSKEYHLLVKKALKEYFKSYFV
jgi:5-methylcytosine-specific restriction endonuclease McrA